MNEQIKLFEEPKKTSYKSCHGGVRTKGSRKEERPLSFKDAIHLVVKSKKAIGSCSFYTHKNDIKDIIDKYALKCGVVIKDYVNMGNHLHIKVKITERKLFAKFLRIVTGLIARLVTGARKGKSFGRFWDGIPFTRIVKTAFEELQLKGYFRANRVEKEHGYKAREEFLQKFNAWVYQLRRYKKKAAT